MLEGGLRQGRVTRSLASIMAYATLSDWVIFHHSPEKPILALGFFWFGCYYPLVILRQGLGLQHRLTSCPQRSSCFSLPGDSIIGVAPVRLFSYILFLSCICVCVSHVCGFSQRPKNGIRSHGAGASGGCEAPYGCSGN